MPQFRHHLTGQEITVSGAEVESAYQADPAWRPVADDQPQLELDTPATPKPAPRKRR